MDDDSRRSFGATFKVRAFIIAKWFFKGVAVISIVLVPLFLILYRNALREAVNASALPLELILIVAGCLVVSGIIVFSIIKWKSRKSKKSRTVYLPAAASSKIVAMQDRQLEMVRKRFEHMAQNPGLLQNYHEAKFSSSNSSSESNSSNKSWFDKDYGLCAVCGVGRIKMHGPGSKRVGDAYCTNGCPQI